MCLAAIRSTLPVPAKCSSQDNDMAQLDEARTTADTVAAHTEDHNTLHRKANYVFDPFDYGAVGDSVTDDTAAVQAAIDAAGAEPGGVVVLESMFLITDSLTVDAVGAADRQLYMTIVGRGAHTGFELDPTCTGPGIIIGAPETEGRTSARDMTLKDFTIIGGGGGALQHGISSGQVLDQLRISRVRIGNPLGGPTNRGPGGHGIHIAYNVYAHIDDCIISQCGKSGIHVLTGDYPGGNATRVTGTSSRENGEHGLHIEGDSTSGHFRVDGGIFESNTGSGLYIEKGKALAIDGAHLENNGAAVFIGAYSSTLRDMVAVRRAGYHDRRLHLHP